MKSDDPWSSFKDNYDYLHQYLTYIFTKFIVIRCTIL